VERAKAIAARHSRRKPQSVHTATIFSFGGFIDVMMRQPLFLGAGEGSRAGTPGGCTERPTAARRKKSGVVDFVSG
jgi:hypothetical protein